MKKTKYSELSKAIELAKLLCTKYKGLYIQSKNQISFVKFDFNAFYHCLGLNRTYKNNRIPKQEILKKVTNDPEKFLKKKVLNNRTISKMDKKYIFMKIYAFIELMNFLFDNIQKIKLNIEQKSEHKFNLIIHSDKNFILICESNLYNLNQNIKNFNFYNYHILSLRNKTLETQKSLLELETNKIEIISMHFVEK